MMAADAIICRPGCGACCIAPSISSPIPGLAAGKPAGMRCPQLDADERCKIFGDARRPQVCGQLRASIEMCGKTRSQAMHWLSALESATAPAT